MLLLLLLGNGGAAGGMYGRTLADAGLRLHRGAEAKASLEASETAWRIDSRITTRLGQRPGCTPFLVGRTERSGSLPSAGPDCAVTGKKREEGR